MCLYRIACVFARLRTVQVCMRHVIFSVGFCRDFILRHVLLDFHLSKFLFQKPSITVLRHYSSHSLLFSSFTQLLLSYARSHFLSATYYAVEFREADILCTCAFFLVHILVLIHTPTRNSYGTLYRQYPVRMPDVAVVPDSVMSRATKTIVKLLLPGGGAIVPDGCLHWY